MQLRKLHRRIDLSLLVYPLAPVETLVPVYRSLVSLTDLEDWH